MLSEGATVLDAGEIGTEMLYYLVGSRGLDGGLMCTASHNPKPLYRSEARAVRRASAFWGARHRGDPGDRSSMGLDEPPGGGTVEEVSLYD